MADKRITTELVVKAVDEYSGMIRNMSGVTGRFAEKVRADMGRLQGLRGPLRMIEDFRKKQQVVRVSGDALDTANDKTRRLLATIRETKNPTAQMRREFERARATAGRLEEKHRRNRAELRGLQSQMQSAGVDTSDLAGEQRRLAGALDAANGKFALQAERMQRLKVMQDRIAEGRKRMDRSLATAANLSFAGNASVQTGRRMLEATNTVATRSGDQQADFTEFQNLTGADDGRMAQLRQELQDLRGVTNQSVSEMLAGLEVLVGKGMDLEAALGALPATARAAFATETSSDEMGGAGFALYDNLKVSPQDLAQAYDIMAMAGKEGGFELTAMAKSFPEITAGARALRMEGLESVAELTAALQISMKSAGSESQAATNLSNFLGKLTSPATVRKFAEVGISIEEELRKATERGVSPMEHMLGVIEAQTGGDALALGELFEDKQVLDFLRAMIPNMEEYARIRDTALGADGIIDADLARKLKDFNTQKGQLGEGLGNLFTLPPEVLDTLTAMMVRADAFVEKLIEWKAENPAFAKGLFLGAGALGAMAVAGGALLTAGAGIIGTLSVLRFGLVGLGARAAFAGGGLTGLAGRFGVLRRLPRFALSSLVAPLSWTARHIPPISWSVRAGSLMWANLVRPLVWTALRVVSPIGWVALAGSLLWSTVIKPLGWDEYLPSIDWGNIVGSLSWRDGVPVIDWSEFISSFSWGEKVVNLEWSEWLSPVSWKDWISEVRWSDKISDLAWSSHVVALDLLSFVPKLFWYNVVEPLGWDKYVPDINWVDWFAFEWTDHLPDWSWNFIPKVDLSGWFKWPEPPAWLSYLMNPPASRGSDGRRDTQSTTPERQSDFVRPSGSGGRRSGRPAGARAFGGSVRAGLPYRVNEHTPKSEWMVPSESGGILNVRQAQAAFMSHFGSAAGQGSSVSRGAQRVRSAGLAGLAASSMALVPHAVAASSSTDYGARDTGSSSVARIEINGGIHIVAPSGVSDPEGLVDLIETRLGERISATFAASFSD